MTEYPTFADLLAAAAVAVGGAPVVRDPGALEAAAARPQTTVFGQDAYPTVASKAAALLHSIVRNHPLVDGNKRLGWLATILFLQLNDHDLHLTDVDVAESFVVDVAAGRLDVAGATEFIAEHWTRPDTPRPAR